MKTYTFTFGFMETVAIEISLRSLLSRLWELYCDAKKKHATTAMIDSLRLDIQDVISAIRKVSER